MDFIMSLAPMVAGRRFVMYQFVFFGVDAGASRDFVASDDATVGAAF
jgi:hypothetical protein